MVHFCLKFNNKLRTIQP